MAMRGDDPLKIKHRTVHKSFTTTEGYIREAKQVTDGFGAVFPELPVALWRAPGASSENRLEAGSGAAGRLDKKPVFLHWWAMKDLNLQPMD
jgi:hypothetical protein